MFNLISRFFSSGHSRSIIMKKNILSSFILRGASIVISLMVIPMTISFVNQTQYGLWLTLSSIISWFSFFDIGLGNGLKTRLTESLANDNYKQGKIYVSTTYAILLIMSILLLFMFFSLQFFLDWAKILNAPRLYSNELLIVSSIVFASFIFQFVLNLIVVVAAANQNTAIGAFINFLGNLLSFVVIYFLTRIYVDGTLLQLCIPICSSPVIVLGLFTIVLYKRKYRLVSPSYKFVDFRCIKDIFSLGLKFFVIQLGLILYYNVDNMVITQVLGPQEVTSYNIGYKYFAIITMTSAIIMTPLWAAFAEANMKGDLQWIEKTVKKLSLLCLGLGLVAFLMVLVSPYVYRYWIGDKIQVPLSLSIVLAFYTVWNTYRTIFIYYLNGTGVVMLQVYLVIGSGIINVPLAIYFAKIYGITGVITATTILCFFCGIVEIIQYKKLINKKASGIWAK